MRTAALAFILTSTILAADSRDVNKTVQLSTTGSLAIENHKGSIRISTWDRPEVDIQARIEFENGAEFDRSRLDATQVLIDSSPNSVSVRTRYPDWQCCNWDGETNPVVRYTIRMPRSARLAIRDHRSDTEVSDLEGALTIDTHRGTVRVHRLSGSLDLTTHRGDVQVEFASFKGNSHVDTHRGTIVLSLPRSSSFDVQAHLEKHAGFDSDFQMLARASRSDRNLGGAVNGGGPTLQVSTHRGNIRLRAI